MGISGFDKTQDQPEVQPVRQYAENLKPAGETAGKMNFKMAFAQAFKYRLRCLLRGNQGGHVKVILCRHWRSDKARIYNVNRQPARYQIEIQCFCKVDQSSFGWAVSGCLASATVPCHAGNKDQSARPLLQQAGN